MIKDTDDPKTPPKGRTILGFPVVTVDDMPKFPEVRFGDLSAYMLPTPAAKEDDETGQQPDRPEQTPE